MRNIKESYNAYKNGDPLTNIELGLFVNHMKRTTKHLDDLGPEFRIMANHCREVTRRNQGYLDAREAKNDKFIKILT